MNAASDNLNLALVHCRGVHRNIIQGCKQSVAGFMTAPQAGSDGDGWNSWDGYFRI